MNRPPHRIPVGSLDALDLPVPAAGLVVGQDPDGGPVVLRLFRPTAVRIAVIGPTPFPELLAFRALGQGAQVVVVTESPKRWSALARAAPPGPAWVTVLPPASPTPPAGSMLRPSLLLEDVPAARQVPDGPASPTGDPRAGVRHDLGAWQASVTLCPAPDRAAQAVRTADLVALTRPDPAQLGLVRDLVRVPAESLHWLPQMPDDVLALVAAGRARFVRLVSSQVERATFAAAPGGTGTVG